MGAGMQYWDGLEDLDSENTQDRHLARSERFTALQRRFSKFGPRNRPPEAFLGALLEPPAVAHSEILEAAGWRSQNGF